MKKLKHKSIENNIIKLLLVAMSTASGHPYSHKEIFSCKPGIKITVALHCFCDITFIYISNDANIYRLLNPSYEAYITIYFFSRLSYFDALLS